MSAREEKSRADRPPELPSLRFGPFTFDPRSRELLRKGHRIAMPASQMRLLTLFVERRGELVTREEIAARLWDDTSTIDVDTGINTAINRLRRNLQDAPGATAPIETVIGLGYRFNPVLKQAEPAENVLGQELLMAEAPEGMQPTLLRHPASESEVDSGENIAPVELSQADQLGQTRWNPVSRPPPWHVHLAGLKPRMLMALAVSGLLLFSMLGILAMRRLEARPAGTGPTPTKPFTEKPSALPPFLRVTADEEAGKLTAAAVSPSGQLVAYADASGVSVRSFPLSATRLLGARPSFTIDRLSWAPDESGLLTSGTDEALHRQQVWFQPVDSPYARLLVENAARASLSPDGGKMAFLRNGDRELWQADADGQRPLLLRRAAKGETYDLVLWSPAGNRLLTTVRKALPTTAHGSTTEADGGGAYEFLAAESGSLLHREEGFSASSGYLLRNGSFCYIKNAKSGAISTNASIMTVQLDLSTGRMLGAPSRVRDLDGFRANHLSASLTGARTSTVLQQVGVAVFVANVKKLGQPLSHVTRLSRNGRETFPHSWTADGKGILVESDSVTPGGPPKWAIYEQPVDGTNPTLLASPPGSPAMAQLTPDGRWILFLEFTEVPQQPRGSFEVPATGLFRMPANGGRAEQVRTTGVIENFRCSASVTGRCVVRESIGNREFVYYALDPLQGMSQELGRTPWQPRLLGDWGLSADGSTVAVVSHDLLRPHISLFRLGSETAQVQEIALQGHGTALAATWAPDGKSLFVECQTESGYELVSLTLAGQLKLLHKSPLQIWAVPSRSGDRIAFPDFTVTASLWATEDRP